MNKEILKKGNHLDHQINFHESIRDGLKKTLKAVSLNFISDGDFMTVEVSNEVCHISKSSIQALISKEIVRAEKEITNLKREFDEL